MLNQNHLFRLFKDGVVKATDNPCEQWEADELTEADAVEEFRKHWHFNCGGSSRFAGINDVSYADLVAALGSPEDGSKRSSDGKVTFWWHIIFADDDEEYAILTIRNYKSTKRDNFFSVALNYGSAETGLRALHSIFGKKRVTS